MAVEMSATKVESFLGPLLRENGAVSHRLANRRNGLSVADRLVTAFDSASRRKGLLGRSLLEPGTALIIAPSNAIHTCFMQFDIDVAFVSKDGRIVKTRASLGPWRMAAAWGAYSVVELPAGTLARLDTRAGDRLVID